MKNYKKPILVVELIKLEDVILQSSVAGVETIEENHTADTDVNITFGGGTINNENKNFLLCSPKRSDIRSNGCSGFV